MQALGRHDYAELGRVVKHDGQVGVVRQQPDVVHHLRLSLGNHVGRSHHQQIDAGGLSVIGQGDHVLGGGVGDMGGGQPLAPGFVGHGVHDPNSLLKGKAPELPHAPGASATPGTQLADVADIMPHSRFVKSILRSEGCDQRGPLAPQILPSPVLGLILLVVGHAYAP